MARLKACLYVSTTARLIGSEDPIIVRPGGRTDGGPLHRGIAHGQWLTRTFCFNLPASKRVRQIEHRIWPVTGSYQRIQTAWLSSRRLDYMSGLGPTATSGYLYTVSASTPTTAPARLALRINTLSGLAEKFAEAGLLVSSNAKPMSWPGSV